jgi:hypothetical protein
MAVADRQSEDVHEDHESTNAPTEYTGMIDEEEWEGFGDCAPESNDQAKVEAVDPRPQKQKEVASAKKHSYNAGKKRVDIVPKAKKRRKV